MRQSEKTSESTRQDAPLLVCVRFLATWLFGGTILGVVLGPWIGILFGLIIAIGWVRAVHWNVVLAALQPRSSRRVKRQGSTVSEP
jgi:hypothetical protein